mmetsp:Transcript_54858/g.129625  ORF Transcript_54858/g.129625 Transcript_54858/m.129625 type:complete len:206 (+) Transcript_54858:216-833(+)
MRLVVRLVARPLQGKDLLRAFRILQEVRGEVASLEAMPLAALPPLERDHHRVGSAHLRQEGPVASLEAMPLAALPPLERDHHRVGSAHLRQEGRRAVASLEADHQVLGHHLRQEDRGDLGASTSRLAAVVDLHSRIPHPTEAGWASRLTRSSKRDRTWHMEWAIWFMRRAMRSVVLCMVWATGWGKPGRRQATLPWTWVGEWGTR